MRPHRRVFVTGGGHSAYMGRGHPEFIWRGHPDAETRCNPDLESHMRDAVAQTVSAAGVDPATIDRAVVSNFLGECFVQQGHMGALLLAVCPELSGIPSLRVEAACASGGVAVVTAVDAIQAGADLVLVVGAEHETDARSMDGIDYMARAAYYARERDAALFTFPHMFARRAKAYKEAFGASSRDIGRVVVKAIHNAKLNPLAQLQHLNVTLDEVSEMSRVNYGFLEDPELRPHMLFYDCTTFTDGASAVLLASERGLKRLGVTEADCTELLSYGHRVSPLGGRTNPLRLDNMRGAVELALTDAGIGSEQIGVAEVHDCFSINELLMYEALGIAREGQGFEVLRDGKTALDGEVPVNTGGGLLGFGHPVGATGVKQVVEIFKQLRGLAGDYQIGTSPQYGVSANMGGDDRTGVAIVQRCCG